MRLFFDTSCLVAAFHSAHPAHEAVWAWYQRCDEEEAEAWTSSHALAETFAVMTALPVKPRPSPRVVADLLAEHLKRRVKVQGLGVRDVQWAIERLGERSLSGGRIYDALHARAALRCRAEVVLTLNRRHFQGIDDHLDPLLTDPATES